MRKMEQKNRILIVEDDTDINNLLYTALQKAGYETVQAFSGTEARMLFQIAGVLLPKITKQEFAILELLLEHPKQVFSKEEIFEYAWDEHYMGETKTLDVHISNIRKKIKAVTQEEYIDTVWGIGYRLHS